MSDVWVEFAFETPIVTEAEVRALVLGVQGLTGILAVESDGAHLRAMYDTARIQPPRIRAYLEETGHPAEEGVEVPGPGDASD
jgi:hypothetical protein